MKRLELPREEMAFRKEYADAVDSGDLTVVFRPGDRVFPKWRGYKKGEMITARIIERVGDDSKMRPPVFSDFKRDFIIKNIEVVRLDALSESDFIGSSDDVADVTGLINQLSWIYHKAPKDYGNEVTRIEIEYVDNFCRLDVGVDSPIEI